MQFLMIKNVPDSYRFSYFYIISLTLCVLISDSAVNNSKFSKRSIILDPSVFYI